MKRKLIVNTIILSMMAFCTPIHAISEKEIVITYPINLNIDSMSKDSRASNTYRRTSGEVSFEHTNNNVTMSCHATLVVTIRVNTATGVITSYDEPVLNVYDCYARGYEVFAENLSTSSSLSSTKRTLNCVGKFNLYARSGTGVRMATSKEFTINLAAG